MKLSYAQNLEDYHLDLVFSDAATGTYVDVGGGHPVADNVTFWFYLKGWRGLVVEPQAALADSYQHIRPRDRVFQGLAGGSDGTAAFHQVEGLHGLSSMRLDAAERAGQYGAGFKTLQMPVRRLDGLIRDTGLTTVDFLKIDVEGAEEQVLAGIDLYRVRPRVIVIEAVNPGNLGGAAGAWEAPVLAAGYRFAFFDNLNRFYVADEAAHLMTRFPGKPASWDRVDHLWDHGRAHLSTAHGDHELASVLTHGLMALLPSLDHEVLAKAVRAGLAARKLNDGSPEAMAALLGTAEDPSPEAKPDTLEAFLQSDRLRAALGRIACFYDGGHLME